MIIATWFYGATVTGAKFANMASSLDAAQAKQSGLNQSGPMRICKISSIYKKDIADGLEEMKQHWPTWNGIQSKIDNSKDQKQMSPRPNSPAIASLTPD